MTCWISLLVGKSCLNILKEEHYLCSCWVILCSHLQKIWWNLSPIQEWVYWESLNKSSITDCPVLGELWKMHLASWDSSSGCIIADWTWLMNTLSWLYKLRQSCITSLWGTLKLTAHNHRRKMPDCQQMGYWPECQNSEATIKPVMLQKMRHKLCDYFLMDIGHICWQSTAAFVNLKDRQYARK